MAGFSVNIYIYIHLTSVVVPGGRARAAAPRCRGVADLPRLSAAPRSRSDAQGLPAESSTKGEVPPQHMAANTRWTPLAAFAAPRCMREVPPQHMAAKHEVDPPGCVCSPKMHEGGATAAHGRQA